MDIASFIEQYGLELVITALVSILFVGIFKIAFKKPLEKIEKSNRKPIYEIASIVFTYGIVAAWLAVRQTLFGIPTDPMTLEMVLKTGSATYVVVKVMYPLYENFKIRDLLQLIGNAIIGANKKSTPAVSDEKSNNDNDKTIVL